MSPLFRPHTLRRMAAWHRWCSMLTFAMVLLWCVTGVPLIFHDPVDIAMGVLPPVQASGPALPLERVVQAAQAKRPQGTVQTLQRFHERRDIWAVGVCDAHGESELLAFREDTAAYVQPVDRGDALTSTMLRLHRELASGTPGKCLVMLLGTAWLGSLFTGMILYGPHMRRLRFGRVRTAPNHVTVSDWHKLLGSITLVWNMVLAATGVALDAATLVSHERLNSVKAYVQAAAPSPAGSHAPLSTALASAESALPNYDASIIYLPGSAVAGPHHAVFLMSPSKVGPIRPRLPVVVDAVSGLAATQLPLPWWTPAVDLMAAIHFGRGSLAYKLAWSLFAGVTITLGFTGLSVFWLRYRAKRSLHALRRQEGLVRC